MAVLLSIGEGTEQVYDLLLGGKDAHLGKPRLITVHPKDEQGDDVHMLTPAIGLLGEHRQVKHLGAKYHPIGFAASRARIEGVFLEPGQEQDMLKAFSRVLREHGYTVSLATPTPAPAPTQPAATVAKQPTPPTLPTSQKGQSQGRKEGNGK